MRNLLKRQILMALFLAVGLIGCSDDEENKAQPKAAQPEVAEDCGKREDSAQPDTMCDEHVEALPEEIKEEGSSGEEVASSIQRGNVISTLDWSGATTFMFRRANVNPSLVRAQLVQYRDTKKSLAWEVIEITPEAAGDTATQGKPFYIIKTRMRTEGVLHRVLIADIKNPLTDEVKKDVEIGRYNLSDKKLDLCANNYKDVCLIGSNKDRNDFTIFAPIK